MKKIYLSLMAVGVAVGAMAQQIGHVGHVQELGKQYPSALSSDRDIECSVDPDSLWLDDFFDRTTGLAIIANIGGGYIFGVNDLGVAQLDPPGATEVAQAYVALDPVAIKEIILFFGAKDEVSADPSAVTLNARIRTMTGTAQGGSDVENPESVTGPGSILASEEFTLADVDTSGNWTVVELDEYVVVEEDFAVTCEFAGLYATGDTVAIVANQPGDAEGNFAFSRIGPSWFETNFAYGNQMEVDVMMFAVACDEYLSVGGPQALNGVQLECYPNPVVDMTTFSYAVLNNMDEVLFELYDAQGRVVHSVNEGAKQEGAYRIDLDLSSLDAGSYYYSVIANGQRVTKKMIKTN